MDRQKNHSEKRKHPRIDKCIPFKLKIDDFNIIAETMNLSCSGVYCQVNKPIPFMTRLKLAFELPGHGNEKEPQYVTCNGVVVRTEKEISKTKMSSAYNIAIFFNEIEKTEKEKIANFIERHKRIK
ncbi:MAG: PilZ domain-containing protein [Candidatus Brocadia sp.]|nr:PilZ domain-containing protein [Candidatus Brocadia sp.]